MSNVASANVAIFSSLALAVHQKNVSEAAAALPTLKSPPQVTPQVSALLDVLQSDMRVVELPAALGLRDSKPFRECYLQPALAAGLIEMTITDKPNSCLHALSPYLAPIRNTPWSCCI